MDGEMKRPGSLPQYSKGFIFFLSAHDLFPDSETCKLQLRVNHIVVCLIWEVTIAEKKVFSTKDSNVDTVATNSQDSPPCPSRRQCCQTRAFYTWRAGCCPDQFWPRRTFRHFWEECFSKNTYCGVPEDERRRMSYTTLIHSSESITIIQSAFIISFELNLQKLRQQIPVSCESQWRVQAQVGDQSYSNAWEIDGNSMIYMWFTQSFWTDTLQFTCSGAASNFPTNRVCDDCSSKWHGAQRSSYASQGAEQRLFRRVAVQKGVNAL